MLKSDWYKERLESQQTSEVELWKQHIEYLEQFLHRTAHSNVSKRLQIEQRLTRSQAHLERVSSENYLSDLVGTIGRQPI
jgi:hypothetical protein